MGRLRDEFLWPREQMIFESPDVVDEDGKHVGGIPVFMPFSLHKAGLLGAEVIRGVGPDRVVRFRGRWFEQVAFMGAAADRSRRAREDSSTGGKLVSRFPALVRLWVDLFSRHQILNSASAISFQALKSLVPLALFGVSALGTVGLADVWATSLRPSFLRQLTPTAFAAVDTAVRKIFADGSPALPVLAAALLLWYLSGLVRACMGGMNLIYEIEERRSFRRRWGTSLALAVSVAVAVVASVLTITTGPRLARRGFVHATLDLTRWPFAALLLGAAVGLLAHYGAAERRQVRWTSVGSAVVVLAWLVESLLFSWYVGSLANFKSASGALIVFLVLAAYLYTASTIFLVGIQLDELLRKDASSGETGIIDVVQQGAGPSR